MTDGKRAFLNSYFCGLYRISGLDATPKIERVGKIDGFGCSVNDWYAGSGKWANHMG